MQLTVSHVGAGASRGPDVHPAGSAGVPVPDHVL